MSDIKKLYDIYTANIARFPKLYEALAEQLGVSAESVYKLGVGLIPCDEYGSWSWVWPERDAKGTVVGLNRRFATGKKMMVAGSNRGLVYAVNYDMSDYDKAHGWERVTGNHPCPICGKPDGCLYPKGEYHNPNAVICVHIKTGSAKPMKLGWLHVLDPVRQKLYTQQYSLLPPTEHPILVVEGASDVCAAYDLDLVAVGKPSAASKSRELIKLLTGRQVVVIGENDAGAGKAGMESTFVQLQTKCPNCTMLMPPQGIKDLRQWVENGLTKGELLKYIEDQGENTLDDDIFESNDPLVIAQTWLKSKTTDGKRTVHRYHNQFVEFDGQVYKRLDAEEANAMFYRDIGGKRYRDDDGGVKPYKMFGGRVNDIAKAAGAFCLIKRDAPCWLTEGEHPDPARLIVFKNGIMDVNEYIQGKIILRPPTPDLFTFSALPYDYDEDAESPLCEQTFADIFEGDEERMLLNQQWFGYNTVPDMSQEKLVLFKGNTRTGKSTILDALREMVGPRNRATTSFQDLSNDFGMDPLIGKLVVTIGDTVGTSRNKEKAVLSKLLNIVGRDTISVNRKNISFLPDVDLTCRFTFAMNDFPKLLDNNGALSKRTLILPFNKSYIGREDTTLKDRVAEEARKGKLINYALRGLKSLYEAGEFIIPQESKMVMRAFNQLVSPIPYFIEHCIKVNQEGPGVPVDHLYAVYRWWCTREAIRYEDKSTLIRHLLSKIPNTLEILDGEVGNAERMFMGIELTAWAEKSYLQG